MLPFRLPTVLSALFLIAIVALASPLDAQRVATQKRGLSSGQAFQIGELDHINLFNGALTLTLPIGGDYPVGPDLSYRLLLAYNHFGWDFEVCPNTNPQVFNHIPDDKYNAGFGWIFTLGQLEGQGSHWTYTSPDGAEHGFYDTLHPGTTAEPNVFYSRDSQYTRLRHFPSGSADCKSPSQATLDCALLEFPDGKVHEFRNFSSTHPDYRITQLRDAHGNAVDVTYPPGGTTWRLSDDHGRTQEIVFGGPAGEYQRPSEIRLETFGGATATWRFEYEAASLARPNFVGGFCTGPSTADVHLLKRVVLPDDSFYELDYFRNTGSGELSGGVRSLRVRTGGELRWTYRLENFPSQQEGPDFLDPAPPPTTAHTASKKEIAETVGGPAIGTWSYDYATANVSAPDEGGACHRATTVTTPAGDATVHYFNAMFNEGWSYSLPFTRCAPGEPFTNSGPFLSTEIYAGSATNGTKLRSVYVDYGGSGSKGNGVGVQEVNARLTHRRTVYHDDSDLMQETRFSDFDGLGHFRTVERTGTFSAQDDQTIVTDFNPDNGTLIVDPSTGNTTGSTFVMPPSTEPWILDTFTERRETANSTTIASEFCFDEAGFLERRRVLAGLGRSNGDLLTVFTKNATGFPTLERLYGGDTQGSLDATYASLCDLTLPVAPEAYRTDHTWSSGALATSTAFDPCDGTAFLSLADNTIDSSTGLVAESRDAAGVSTSFVYDELGRLVAERPLESAWTTIEYHPPTVAEPTIEAKATTRTCTNGRVTCTNAAALAWERMHIDGLGRVSEERVRLPTTAGEVEHSRTFTYDAQGRRLTESMWANPTRFTTFSGHDPFGRVGAVNLPDGTVTRFTYEGARTRTRETRVRLPSGTASAFTTEIFDVRGRLITVCEDRSTAWAGTCDGLLTRYTYDVTDQLKRVCVNADGMSCGQTRNFVYDGRGFLTSETHPELGPTGNGTITYTRDAQGNVLTKRLEGGQPFDLNFSYDAAGRLTHVDEHNGGTPRPLKEFFYGTTNNGTDRRTGKLVQTKRHNWVDIVGPLSVNSGAIDAVVTEVIRYRGLDGRPSARQTRFNVADATFAFDFSQTWDALGNVASITYPQCRHGQADCPSAAPQRTVTYHRLKGFLRSVPGYADTISYQTGGMLHRIDHANGIRTTIESTNGLLRPHRISTTAGWDTGFYRYDGAGNIHQIGTQKYRYDRRNQLVSGEVLVGGTLRTQTATIDDYGNVTQLVTNGAAQTLTASHATNRLTSPLATYDAGGNLTILSLPGEEYQYTYDGVNMMKHLQSSTDLARTFLYNADDERIASFDCTTGVCMSNPVVETWTLRDFGNRVIRTYVHKPNEGWFWKEDYIYRDGQLLAAETPAGTSYLHLDHLGTPRQVTDASGVETAVHSYYPYGEEATDSSVGGLALKFTGHERDSTGSSLRGTLDYMHARYYSSFVARFLSSDRMDGTTSSPLTWNRYNYAMGNPTGMIDPDGRAAVAPIKNFRAPSRPPKPSDIFAIVACLLGCSTVPGAENHPVGNAIDEALESSSGLIFLPATISSAGLSTNAVFAQRTFRNRFSSAGAKALTQLTGRRITSVDDLADAIKKGQVDPSRIPVNIINRNGNTFILNTRTTKALEKAGVPRENFNVVDQSGNRLFERLLDRQLIRNKITVGVEEVIRE